MADFTTIRQKLGDATQILNESDFEFLKENYSDGADALIEEIVNTVGGYGVYAADFAKAIDYRGSSDETQSQAFTNPINDEVKLIRDELVLNYLSANSLNPTLDFEAFVRTGGSQTARRLLDETAIVEASTRNLIFDATKEDIRKGDLERALGNTPAPESDGTTPQEDLGDIKPSVALQCLLLNNLEELSTYYKKALYKKCATNVKDPAKKVDAEAWEDGKVKYPYQGKIIPLNSSPSTTFINNLTLQKNINENFTNVQQNTDISNNKKSILGTALPQHVTTKMRLSFIKQISTNGNQRLVELPILKTDKVEIFESDGSDGARNYSESQGYDIEDPFNILDNLEWSIKIKYEGTNPATYRNDVSVDLKITTDKLDRFTNAWKYSKLDKEFNLFDLVLFPYYESDGSGYGRIFKSQFSPNYNRIRLYLSTEASGLLKPEIRDFYSKNNTVLDLSPVDNSFERDKDGLLYVLTVNYRGYIQSVLTSPELDALTSKTIKNRRKDRDSALREAAAQGCALKEMQKISSQLTTLAERDPKTITYDFINSFNKRSKTSSEYPGFGFFSVPVRRLSQTIQSGGIINFGALSTAIQTGGGLTIDVNDLSGTQLAQSSLANTTPENSDPTAQAEDLNVTQLSFFYLGDLLDVILGNTGVYEGTDNYAATSNDFYKQNLRFIIGSFHDQKSGTDINLAHLPISFDFFREWYQETVLDKELFLYPALSMIRDLVERVVTNLLSEVCFTVDEKNSTLARVAFFTGVGGQTEAEDKVFSFWKNKSMKSNNGDVPILTEATPEAPLIYPSYTKDISQHVNYCVLYATGPQNGFNNATLSNTPHFYIDNSNYVGPSVFKFNRTSATFLREARYFRSSTSGITQLAGVYETTIDLAVPIYTIYPSTFYRVTLGSENRYAIPGTNLDLFTELGINGYYAIKAVTIDLKGALGAIESKVTINGIWTDSENPTQLVRQTTPEKDRSITEEVQRRVQEKCLDIIDAVETSIQSLGRFGFDLPETSTIEEIAAEVEAEFELAQQAEEVRLQEAADVQAATQRIAEQLAQGGDQAALIVNAQSSANLPVGTTQTIGEYRYTTDTNGNVNIYKTSDNAFVGVYNQATGVTVQNPNEEPEE